MRRVHPHVRCPPSDAYLVVGARIRRRAGFAQYRRGSGADEAMERSHGAVWEATLRADYYYDAARGYYQIADYTKDPSWTKCAEQAVAAYRDQYLVPNKFAAAGWMIFPRGLWLHYQKTGDVKSKDAVIQLAGHASYCCVPEWLKDADASRVGAGRQPTISKRSSMPRISAPISLRQRRTPISCSGILTGGFA